MRDYRLRETEGFGWGRGRCVSPVRNIKGDKYCASFGSTYTKKKEGTYCMEHRVL